MLFTSSTAILRMGLTTELAQRTRDTVFCAKYYTRDTVFCAKYYTRDTVFCAKHYTHTSSRRRVVCAYAPMCCACARTTTFYTTKQPRSHQQPHATHNYLQGAFPCLHPPKA